MTNIFFEDEEIKENDLYFLCYMIERVARRLHQRNKYVVNQIERNEVYMRLILNTLQPEENYIDGMIRVYNHEICEVIDNYNSSAYFEPSYVIERAYYAGEF